MIPSEIQLKSFENLDKLPAIPSSEMQVSSGFSSPLTAFISTSFMCGT